MIGKTKKSVTKRFKVTKTGKVLHRKGPKNHFRAKQTSKTIRNSRGRKELAKPDARKIKLLV
jgi:large subunit ribosomal protein L35